MNDIELDQCIAGIEQRWPEQLTDQLAGDLRSALRPYPKEAVSKAVREVRLKSNFRIIPVGKILDECKRLSPQTGGDLSKKLVTAEGVHIQNTVTGSFFQFSVPANYTPDQILRAAEDMRQIATSQEKQEFIVVRGATHLEMMRSNKAIAEKYWAARDAKKAAKRAAEQMEVNKAVRDLLTRKN